MYFIGILSENFLVLFLIFNCEFCFNWGLLNNLQYLLRVFCKPGDISR